MNNQNLIYDISRVLTGSEPVTLGEMKDYLRLEGFTDTDESTTDSLWDFDYDDTLITNMIKAAREKAEKFTGCSFADHTITVVFTLMAGDLELPYGPIQDFTSLTYKNGTAVGSTVYSLIGTDFKIIEEPLAEKMTMVYDAGYEACPEEVRLAIKQTVAYWYDQRSIGDMPALAMHTLAPFKRAWTWLA